jgi:hypothetical protein
MIGVPVGERVGVRDNWCPEERREAISSVIVVIKHLV